jgi:PII-like signaling protein
MQDQELGDLCREAMHEKDVNKLLMIFLELNRATEGEHLMEVFTEAIREHQGNRAN